ncbi:MAG: hypothetical protein GF320_15105 [Armatimonadia bacterium]|nr:hypothetical protein [Armatimonadia bacterium]
MALLPDIASGMLAWALGGLVWFVPGWGLAAWINIAGFRESPPWRRCAIALCASISVMPAATYIAGRVLGPMGPWLPLGVCWVAAMVSAAGRPGIGGTRREWLTAASFGGGIGLLVLLCLSDIRWGDHLLVNAAMFDHAKHTAVVASLSEWGLPPVNPFYRPGHDFPLAYYHLWHYGAALVDRLGGSALSARAAVLGSAGWAASGLVSLVLLLADERCEDTSRGRPVRMLAAALLLCSGLDVVPWVIQQASSGPLDGIIADLEAWNEQVTAWVGQVLWVPQHVCGLVACAFGLLLARRALLDGGGLRAPSFLAGIAFGSGAGMSPYVFMATAGASLVWVIWEARVGGRRVPAVAAIGVSALLTVLVPLLLEIRSANVVDPSWISVDIRRFTPIEGLIAGMPSPARAVARLAALPVSYGLELGFFALAGVVYIRQKRPELTANSGLRAEVCLAGVSLLMAALLRSTRLNNDLGWRAVEPAQLVLLLWAADLLAHQRGVGPRGAKRGWSEWGARHRLLASMLAAGLITSVVSVSALRFAEPLNILLLGPDTLAELRLRDDQRRVHEWIRASTPVETVVQTSPLAGDRHHDLPRCWYSDRLTALGNRNSVVCFAPTPAALEPAVHGMFATEEWEDVEREARRWGIDLLVVNRTAPIWTRNASWVWTQEPVYETPLTRVIAVGDRAPALGAG